MAHSKFSPSKMSRIMECPGSIKMSEQVPAAPSSPYAMEGTMLHTFMAKAHDESPDCLNDPALNTEQRHTINDAWDYASQVVRHGHGSISMAEVQVAIEDCPEVYGTADLIVYNEKDAHLDVLDYKFGANVFVEAKNNRQMQCYALGALGYLPKDAEVITIAMHVVQPRMANYSREVLTREELMVKRDEIVRAVAAAKSPEPSLAPGPEQCRWCNGAAVCPARHAEASAAAARVFAMEAAVNASAPVAMEDIVQFYKDQELLKSSMKIVNDFIMAELLRKKSLPGLKLVRTRANRSWTSEAEATRWLLSYAAENDLETEDILKYSLVTPAAAEKLIRGAKNNKPFQKLITKGQGKLAVVPDNDPRPEATFDATEAFAGMEE